MEIRESKGIIRPDLIHLLMQARKGTLQSEDNGTVNSTTTKPSKLYVLFLMPYMRAGTLIVATIYFQWIQNRYLFQSFIVLRYSHQCFLQPIASDVEVVKCC